jgi:ectoine hydroxylase-related dioxygenase (phytanoyl-CoA dioxygenase family)
MPKLNNHPCFVSEEQCRAYVRDGIIKISGFLSPAWIALLAESINEIRETLKHDIPESVDPEGSYSNSDSWTFNGKMKRFAFESDIAAVAAELMASREIRLYETLTLFRASGSQGTPWHQDMPQHGVIGQQTCNIWLSLEPVTEETGALRVVPGSHRGPWYTPYCMPAGREDDLIELEGGPMPDPDANRERFPRILSYDTEPGDIIIFHPATLHSTKTTSKDIPRRSISVRLFGDDIRRRSSRCEWHAWLKELNIPDGQPMICDRIPRVFPR